MLSSTTYPALPISQLGHEVGRRQRVLILGEEDVLINTIFFLTPCGFSCFSPMPPFALHLSQVVSMGWPCALRLYPYFHSAMWIHATTSYLDDDTVRMNCDWSTVVSRLKLFFGPRRRPCLQQKRQTLHLWEHYSPPPYLYIIINFK